MHFDMAFQQAESAAIHGISAILTINYVIVDTARAHHNIGILGMDGSASVT